MASNSNGRLKIVHVLEAAGGGSGRHVLDLTEGLIDRNHIVTVIYSPVRAEKSFVDKLLSIRNVNVHALNMQRSIGYWDILDGWRLRGLLRTLGSIDILHAHSSKAGALARLPWVGARRKRVYTPHAIRTMDPTMGTAGRVFYGGIEKALGYLSTDAIIVGSEQEYNACLRVGLPSQLLRVVINGIKVPNLLPRREVRRALGVNEGEIVLGMVGRLTYQKAPERLVGALEKMPRDEITVLLLGDGEEKTCLTRRILELGLGKRIKIHSGFDGQANMPAFDFLVVPSRYESMGYVFLEAAAAGIPIISTDVGIASIVVENGVNGIIVPNVDDPGVWASSIEKALLPQNFKKFAENARKKKAQFDVEQMVEQTLQIYRELLNLPRAS